MATIKIQTGLRLNESLYEKVKFLSSRENRSLNNFIEYAVQQYVDKYESENGVIQNLSED